MAATSSRGFSCALLACDRDALAAGPDDARLSSVAGATAATSSWISSSPQVVFASTHEPASFSQAPTLQISWQVNRSGTFAGRDRLRDRLNLQGAPTPGPVAFALTHPSSEHAPFPHLSPWPLPTVPVPSLTTLCPSMLVGAAAASAIVGCEVVDVKRMAGAFSGVAAP